jgi:hypothetical protein
MRLDPRTVMDYKSGHDRLSIVVALAASLVVMAATIPMAAALVVGMPPWPKAVITVLLLSDGRGWLGSLLVIPLSLG